MISFRKVSNVSVLSVGFERLAVRVSRTNYSNRLTIQVFRFRASVSWEL